MEAASASLLDRVCCGSWRTRWGPSEELKQHYPPRHSGRRVKAARRGARLANLQRRRLQRRRPERMGSPADVATAAAAAWPADYRDSAPEPLSDVFELYRPVVQQGRWTHGLIEMW